MQFGVGEQSHVRAQALPNRRGRKRIHSPRQILNAILYVLRTGCPWHMLPHDFPARKTVYHFPPLAHGWHMGAAERRAGQGAARGARAGG
ncbi:MAG: transposase [Thermoflexales bacterium]|nr:transposase [Thermoflexales bacterium]